MNDNAMSVLSHLNELKRRLFRVAIVAVVFIAVAVFNFRWIFNEFTAKARELIEAAGGDIIQLTLTEAWVAAAKLAVMVGLTAALPYFLWEMSRFFQPGLKSNERKYVYFLIPGSLISFAIGASFAYLVLIPRLFEFMLQFQGSLAVPTITAASVVSMTVGIIFWLGTIFELPIVMFLLAKIGILTSGWLKTKRRWMILIAFIFGAAVTPTDPVSQVIVAIPVMLLFEIGMLLVKFAERGREE
ncbi:twin-arginine translocase subunit TatC [Candidatus Lucifugimonas marina]|uniref:Sec-independent protein translocase protein TatC n=1 Tax=Candidatus Lucifugimonas marina TaxID=3038979 RepID=A0AAJ5ZJ94_9CHLR|nr:twin-arginine translocase subunit TatC [SAR202 cluster bacterium JH702]MDG0870818.1 twin-arginine translocase subunit TatC [SAR202 cluster bacterium JH639]WFG36462.1 twin-arginine translocase subunit TatC [SAR202 cluster bacterium JH545]WFG40395.1 twin-arginine translocase subunit TatC [SAR202 cluster bacterium JH1073]